MSACSRRASDASAVRSVIATGVVISCPPLRTAPSAASSRSSASSTSASVMTSGGSSRTTVSAVRFTMTPRSSAAGTTGAASRVSSRPHIRPAPRTSLTIGVPGGHRAEPLLEDGGRRAPTCAMQPAADQLVEEAQRRAAGEQVAAVGAAVIAERDRVRDLLADERRADRHAAAERLAERDQVRLQAERREVERVAGAAEAALHFVGDEQRAGRRRTPR